MRIALLLLTLLIAPPALAAGLSVPVARLDALNASTGRLALATDAYYALAWQADFDYAWLWKRNSTEVKANIERIRVAWHDASPRYEQIEGFFCGTRTLRPLRPDH